MRVIGYCRVSTLDQANEGVSLDAQQARIAAWAESRGHTLDPLDIHVDAGISGKRSDNRPALKAALDAACGPGRTLVVYSLSRLARSVPDAYSIVNRLTKADADLVSLTEQIDTTTASGKMFFGIMAVFAQFERDLVSERTRTALGQKRSRGQRVGQIPYGMRLGEDGLTLECDPFEGGVLAWMLQAARDGQTFREIATRLNAGGVLSKNLASWSHRTVGRIIERESKRAARSERETHPELSAS